MGARLARYTGDTKYSDWAEKTWDWVEKVGFIDPNTYAVYDGATVDDNCKVINQVQYSYNNAIFAEGAAFMYNHVCFSSINNEALTQLSYCGNETNHPSRIRQTAIKNGKTGLINSSPTASRLSSRKTSPQKFHVSQMMAARQTCSHTRALCTVGTQPSRR